MVSTCVYMAYRFGFRCKKTVLRVLGRATTVRHRATYEPLFARASLWRQRGEHCACAASRRLQRVSAVSGASDRRTRHRDKRRNRCERWRTCNRYGIVHMNCVRTRFKLPRHFSLQKRIETCRHLYCTAGSLQQDNQSMKMM